MEYLIMFCLACGVIGGLLGIKKGIIGRSFFLGLLLGPLGLLIILFVKGKRKECLYCVKSIHEDALICPYCRSDLPGYFGQPPPEGISIMQGIAYAIGGFLLSGFIAVGTILLLANFFAEPENLNTSKSVETGKLSVSDRERLNVSKPTFSKEGITFILNDTRPNSSMWISIDIGKDKADKNLMTWVSFSSTKPGAVFISFRDCKYLDGGINSLISANKCKATIGAKLKANDKTVYTDYDVPVADLRTALFDAVR